MPWLLCFAVYIKRFCVQSFSLEVFLSPSIFSLYVFLRRLAQKYKRDRPTKHFLSPYQPHILDSNGVWYSPFWLEGPKNHPNLKILVSKFVPRDLEAQRKMINHWSLLLVALPLETPWRCPSKPLGAAPRNPCAAPRNPMALCLETPGAPRLKTPGDKFWDQNFQVSVVFRPLRPKRAIPHPITIQNMRFRR